MCLTCFKRVFTPLDVEMDEIEPGLFLGNVEAAESIENIKLNGITHIVGIIHYKPIYPKSVKTLFFQMDDLPNSDLLTKWDKTFNFIEEGRSQKKGKVLVHCLAGISRSSSTVVAYLMRKHSLSFQESLERVKEKHLVTFPNYGFRKQLKLYENMGCRLDITNTEFLSYIFNNLPSKPYFKLLTEQQNNNQRNRKELRMEDFIFEDPDKMEMRMKDSEIYRCRHCRRSLFTGDVIVSHLTPKRISAPAVPSHTCLKRLFRILPVKWMPYENMRGQLMCPKCSTKLGDFDWLGKQCICGTFVIPSFQVLVSTVEKPT